MIRGLPVALTGWSPGQDTWRIRRHPGNYHSPESQCSRGFRGRVAHSHDIRENSLGSALGDTCQLPKGLRKGGLRAGFRKGLPEGFSGGWLRVVRLEING